MDHQPEDSTTTPPSTGRSAMEPMPVGGAIPSADGSKQPVESAFASGKNGMDPSPTTSSAMNGGDVVDEATIQQIVRFWNHPSLQGVPTPQKQEYLQKKGIRQEQIFQAWDRIVQNQQSQATTGNPAAAAGSDLVSSFQAQQPPPQPNANPYASSTQQHATSAMPTGMAAAQPPHGVSPYNNNPHPNPPYYDTDYDPAEEMGGTLSANSAAVIATVGGLLGLLAAATVRWLNGGDFLLFPPPSRIAAEDHHKRSRQSAHQQPSEPQDRSQDVTEEEEEEEDQEEEDDNEVEQMGDEEGSDGDPELARYLSSSSPTVKPDVIQHAMAQFMALSETLQQHVTVQQRILQKLTSNSNNGGQNSGANVTDRSMQVLRQQQQRQNGASTNGGNSSNHNSHWLTAQDPMLWYKLVEIQVELASLKGKMGAKDKNDDDELEKQLSETLKQLQTVLTSLQPKLENGNNGEEEGGGSDGNIESTTASTDTATVTTNDNAETKEVTIAVAKTEEKSTEEPSFPGTLPGEATPAALKDDPDNPLPPDDTAKPEGTPPPPNNDDGTAEASIIRNVRKVFIDLVRQNTDDPAALKAGFQMLFLYISNLSKNPHVPRYRKIYTSNASYNKVNRLQGGREFLNGLGFVLSADKRVLEWPPVPTELEDDGSSKTLSSQEKEKLVETYHLSESAAALAILKDVSPQATKEAEEEAALTLLEKALDVLPCPPESSTPRTVATTEPASGSNDETQTVDDKTNDS